MKEEAGGEKVVEKYISSKDAIDAVRACCLEASACNLQCIKDIPAADVRPVVRGKWEDVNVRDYSTNINGGLPLNVASMCCSVCKRWHNEVYHYGNPTEMARFCPNCGADMREEPPKEEADD